MTHQCCHELPNEVKRLSVDTILSKKAFHYLFEHLSCFRVLWHSFLDEEVDAEDKAMDEGFDFIEAYWKDRAVDGVELRALDQQEHQ